MLYTEFPHLTQNVAPALGVFGQIDTYNTALYNNGAFNPIGGSYIIPSAIASGSAGSGAALIVKYVRYNSTSNPNCVGGPAVVYWADETYQVVTGKFSESYSTSTGDANSVAGFLLINTVNSGKTGAALATALNGNFTFIAIGGFVAGCAVPASTAIGDLMTGTGDFVLTRTATGTWTTTIPVGLSRGAVSGGLADMIVFPAGGSVY